MWKGKKTIDGGEGKREGRERAEEKPEASTSCGATKNVNEEKRSMRFTAHAVKGWKTVETNAMKSTQESEKNNNDLLPCSANQVPTVSSSL